MPSTSSCIRVLGPTNLKSKQTKDLEEVITKNKMKPKEKKMQLMEPQCLSFHSKGQSRRLLTAPSKRNDQPNFAGSRNPDNRKR